MRRQVAPLGGARGRQGALGGVFGAKWMYIGQIRGYGLGGRPQAASDDLKHPQMTSSDIKRPNNWDFGQKSGFLLLKWMDIGQIRGCGLGGRCMTSGRPRRSASGDLKRPQMTSILLKKLKFVNIQRCLVPVTKSLGKIHFLLVKIGKNGGGQSDFRVLFHFYY